MKICAVIVTYNRLEWLKCCLESLVNQKKLSGIIVVNNASNDGTKDYLGTLVSRYSGLDWHIHHNEINTGGAGGFSKGMELAHKIGYEWTWLMDDDVIAKPDGLEQLLKFSNQADFLHGIRKNPDGSTYFWQHTFISWVGFSLPYADTAFKKNTTWVTNSACFEGALIHKRVFDKIGYANPDYFLAWDDTDFGYRASKHFKILYCNVVVMQRLKGVDNVNIKIRSLFEANDNYRYYHIRNRFLLAKTVQKLEPYRSLRILKTLTFHSFTFVLIIKEMVRSLIFRDWTLGLKPLILGWWDGFTGQFNKHRFLQKNKK